MTTLARATLVLAFLAPSLAAAQTPIATPSPNPHVTEGVITNIAGRDITLDNGRHAILRDHTTINPTGARLRDGITIYVTGIVKADGTIDAQVVDANVNGNHYGDRNGYNFPHEPTPLPAVASASPSP